VRAGARHTPSRAPHSLAAAFVRSLDALAAAERDRAAVSANHGQSSLAAQVRRACDAVQDGLVERDTEVRCPNVLVWVGSHCALLCAMQVRLLLLAALSNEHLLLIGKPGTAKSQLGRRLRCGLC